MSKPELERRVAAIREFNRFYTGRIGVLNQELYQSPFSLSEARVLYELAHRPGITATELCQDLGLDAGYLSRIVRSFQRRRLLERGLSPKDRRQSLLSLTKKGRSAFAPLNARSRQQVAALLKPLRETEQQRLVDAAHAIQGILGTPQGEKLPYLLRQHRPGDMGWVVHRHGALYAQEYGYDERFEALVARIVAEFVENHDPKRERCWIAEKDGEIVGSVFLVKKSSTVAKLRLLFVEPKTRGLGIGARLVDECVRFAGQCGYCKIVLWTQSELKAARHIYQKAGFKPVAKKPHTSWGKNLVSEVWEMKLRNKARPAQAA